jgi:streptogramin lyase
MLIAQSRGMVAFDGSNWEDYSETDFTSLDAIAYDAAGNIWVTDYQGVSTFDGSWMTYSASELATGEAASDLVNDVVIDPDGLVWVVTSNSVASFDGEVCLRMRTG